MKSLACVFSGYRMIKGLRVASKCFKEDIGPVSQEIRSGPIPIRSGRNVSASGKGMNPLVKSSVPV